MRAKSDLLDAIEALSFHRDIQRSRSIQTATLFHRFGALAPFCAVKWPGTNPGDCRSICRNSKATFFSRNTIAARCTQGHVLKLTKRYFAIIASPASLFAGKSIAFQTRWKWSLPARGAVKGVTDCCRSCGQFGGQIERLMPPSTTIVCPVRWRCIEIGGDRRCPGMASERRDMSILAQLRCVDDLRFCK